MPRALLTTIPSSLLTSLALQSKNTFFYALQQTHKSAATQGSLHWACNLVPCSMPPYIYIASPCTCPCTCFKGYTVQPHGHMQQNKACSWTSICMTTMMQQLLHQIRSRIGLKAGRKAEADCWWKEPGFTCQYAKTMHTQHSCDADHSPQKIHEGIMHSQQDSSRTLELSVGRNSTCLAHAKPLPLNANKSGKMQHTAYAFTTGLRHAIGPTWSFTCPAVKSSQGPNTGVNKCGQVALPNWRSQFCQYMMCNARSITARQASTVHLLCQSTQGPRAAAVQWSYAQSVYSRHILRDSKRRLLCHHVHPHSMHPQVTPQRFVATCSFSL